MKRARILFLLLVGAAVWLPTLHLFYGVDGPEREELASRLAAQQVAMATPAAAAPAGAPTPTPTPPPTSVAEMRSVNPEWDFMRRTYSVLALANRALAFPSERTKNLAAIDAVVDATIATADGLGDDHFMLPYAKQGAFMDREAKSLFIDGEIIAMIAARDLVEPRQSQSQARRKDAQLRAERIERAMRASPSLSGESYPNECWTFCNTTALAGLTMLDRATGSDHHSALARDWVANAKAHLVDPKTGILVSSYTYDGRVLDGPEGSSIWMTASNLLIIDEAFARDQYARARRELGASLFGFGWAREWPRSTINPRPDVDSGPIVPFLDASAGSSGLAILGASAFGDKEWLGSLLTSLELAGFRDERTGHYRASNDVGDAVLSYALSFGPLWRRVKEPERERAALSATATRGGGGAR